jgi:[lysine-biosynthesis-protein LysW]---L-2-aminoadipate ligase
VLAVAAAAAVGADIVGVDLLPLRDGRFVVLEVNGAVDFTSEYSLPEQDVFDEIAALAARAATGRAMP